MFYGAPLIKSQAFDSDSPGQANLGFEAYSFSTGCQLFVSLRYKNLGNLFESLRKQSVLLALPPRTKKAPKGAHFCIRGGCGMKFGR